MPTLPQTMAAVHLTGHGGPEKLQYVTDAPVPQPAAGEVLIKIHAAGMNNTDINTRIGWYSKSVTGATNTGAGGYEDVDAGDASWSGATIQFPRIQGADCCGTIVAVGEGVAPARVGQRVLVQSMHPNPNSDDPLDFRTFGSELDGGFAQYTVAPDFITYAVNCDWTDAELASIPCAYSTAENMLHRTKVGAETVLITGASGGVGSAAIQLAKRRGARVIAVAGASKSETVKAIGADMVLDRNADLLAELGEKSVDVVVDLVAGDGWPSLLELLKVKGRYVTSGAIAGPMVTLDVRTLYLKDLTLLGCTWQDQVVFENLISYIEKGEIKPLVAQTYPLSEINAAQEVFLQKTFVGKLVLIPPQ